MILALTNSYIGLVIVAIFEGLEMAFFSGNNQAFIYDTLKEVGKEDMYKHYLGKTNSMYITNSVFPTDVAKSDISQSLYKDEYRSSMGSLKSLVGSVLYSIFAILVGLLADWNGAIFALFIAQFLKFIVVGIYGEILKMRNLKILI